MRFGMVRAADDERIELNRDQSASPSRSIGSAADED
jgi:hypothetical protein